MDVICSRHLFVVFVCFCFTRPLDDYSRMQRARPHFMCFISKICRLACTAP